MSQPADVVTQRALARVGRTLRDKWRLDRLLGVGGMAAVYAGTHRNGSRGAIKMLHVELSLEEEIRKRFLREGYVANAVGHPGVVRVLDDDVAEDGSVFLVMELLSGETLDARFERKGGRLPIDEVLPPIHELLEVLAAAHEKGIVHRDVKPENIFLNQDGSVKLLDFGIARLRDLPAKSGTISGAALGTPAFMPPEQALGSSSEIGPATDLWAVGATIFQLLSGRTVHEAETPNALLVKAATTPARSLAAVAPDVAKPIVALVDRALAYEKKDRWPSARAMADALQEAYREATGATVRDAAPLSIPAPRESAAIQTLLGRPRTETTGGAGASSRAVAPSRPAPPPSRLGAIAMGALGAVVGLAVVFLVLDSRRTHAVAAPAEAPAAVPLAPAPPSHPPAEASAPAASSAPSATSAAPSAPVASPALEKTTARLTVQASGGVCDVLVDGEPLGKTPIDDAAIEPGDHKVTCKLPSGGAVMRRVRVSPTKPGFVAFALAPIDPMDKRK